MKISSVDVRQFKQRYSDENEIVAGIIRERLYDKFEELIVDVGAGMGDITSRALPLKKVVQLDILDYGENALADQHCRVLADFFDYSPTNGQKIGTLFFSHVLQFLDQSVDRLNDKIQTLRPKRIITVTNLNDGFMREVIHWVESNVQNANPEVQLAEFPREYELENEIQFKGHVRCTDFPVLGKQVSYLVDSQPSPQERVALQRFLQANLADPEFSINQTIKVYKKHER
jgi:trans-aconitate methyltransferase